MPFLLGDSDQSKKDRQQVRGLQKLLLSGSVCVPADEAGA